MKANSTVHTVRAHDIIFSIQLYLINFDIYMSVSK